MCNCKELHEKCFSNLVELLWDVLFLDCLGETSALKLMLMTMEWLRNLNYKITVGLYMYIHISIQTKRTYSTRKRKKHQRKGRKLTMKEARKKGRKEKKRLEGRTNGWTEGKKEGQQTDRQRNQVEKGRGRKKQGQRQRQREERRKEQSKNGKGTKKIYLHLVPIFTKLIKRNIINIMTCVNLANIKTPF